MKIEPAPSLEEAAAIMAALETLREKEPEETPSLTRSRWKLAGLLWHPPPATMRLEGSLWAYSGWERMA